MIYRVDRLEECAVNPITGRAYDDSWMIFMPTDNVDYRMLCGRFCGCAYTIKISRRQCMDWELSAGDFISFHETVGKNAILVMTETELGTVLNQYTGHRYDDPFLRKNEPEVLIHSTPMANWESIRRDGMLKSWNRIRADGGFIGEKPIGEALGDPEDFREYIMFGDSVTCEIVVNSKQTGKIVMDEDAPYLTGARLYFDARKMAGDGLLVRDGCHIKVKNEMPLDPYLIWAATWDQIGLSDRISTPKRFAQRADEEFKRKMSVSCI